MRAFLSDLDKRSRWLDYMETHYTATVEETGVTPEDWVLNTAWGEARAIMETEQGLCYRLSPVPALGPLVRQSREAAAALAESLRSFVEA